MSNKLEKAAEFFKIEKFVKMNKSLLVTLLCLGIFLMVLPQLFSGRTKEISQNTNARQVSPASGQGSEIQQEEAVLSRLAEETLRQIKGVGDVKVQVTLEKGTGYDTQGGFAASSQRQVSGPQVRGVVVAAQGAKDPAVRWQLYQAVQALYDIPLNAVFVAEGLVDKQ